MKEVTIGDDFFSIQKDAACWRAFKGDHELLWADQQDGTIKWVRYITMPPPTTIGITDTSIMEFLEKYLLNRNPSEPMPTLEQLCQEFIDARGEYLYESMANDRRETSEDTVKGDLAYRLSQKRYFAAEKRYNNALDAEVSKR